MTTRETAPRPEFRGASDAVIEDAIAHADPMVLRGLLSAILTWRRRA